jgi:hypothetical protein
MNTNADHKLDADRLVEQAKESLMSRVEELSRRFKDAKNKFDVEAQIAAHPLPAIGIAFAIGAVFALAGGRKHTPDAHRGIGGAMMAGLGALAMRMLKDVALGQLSGAARAWMEGNATDGERTASRDRSVESFLEH